MISNTGDKPSIPPEKLFERFRKSNQSADSQGLGLAIVKEVCKASNLEINYAYRDNLHVIQVLF